MMIVKIHKGPFGTVVAMCDSGILGKRFEEGNRQLDLSAAFYRGDELSEEDACRYIAGRVTINAVGNVSVDFLLRKGFIGKKDVLLIANVPYVQCVVE